MTLTNPTSFLRLEVETLPPAGKTKNLIKNYDGTLGGWNWITPTGGTMGSSNTAGWIRFAMAPGATYFQTEPVSVLAGQYVSARWKGDYAAGITLTARVDFLDSTGTLISSSATSSAFAGSTSTYRNIGPFLAPAGTVMAAVIYTQAGAVNGNNLDLTDVGFVAMPTNAAVVWTDVVNGPTWLNILGSSTEMSWDRSPLNLGILNAVIRDATMDPSVATTIRPGRQCRVTALHATTGVWEPLFTGEVTDFDVDYDTDMLAKAPTNPKTAIITISALDATRKLSNTPRPIGVDGLLDLRTLLEGAGVPWSINGDNRHARGAVQASVNENASLVDQIAITRDSKLALAWVDRSGILNVFDGSVMRPFLNNDFEVDLSGWTSNGTATRVTTPVASGVGALRTVSVAAGTTSVTTSNVKVVKGHNYSVSVKTRAATTGRPTRLVLNWRDKGNLNVGTVSGSLTTNTTTGWTTHTITGVAPVDAVNLFVTIQFTSVAGSGETFYVDELRGINAEVVLNENAYRTIKVGSQSTGCINVATVKYLRYVPTDDRTEEVVYGPYRNEASIAEFGVRSSTFTIQGGTEDPTTIKAYADSVLAANGSPKTTVSSVTVPILNTSDLTTTKAMGDLYQTARVSLSAKSVDQYVRIAGVKHNIVATPKDTKWSVEYSFADPTSVESPTWTPSPPVDATVAVSNFPGDVRMFAGSTAPVGWLFCQGQAVSRTTYKDLFAVIGTTFGTGDGSTTFNVPNFNGRSPMGPGSADSGSVGNVYGLGQKYGHEALQSHHHTAAVVHVNVIGGDVAATVASGASYGFRYDGSPISAGTGNSGNIHPILGMNFIIRAYK